MKQSLQLSIGQHLTLTPQLQQAIRLLQLSTLDLQQEIQQILETNPMLEANPVEQKEEPETPKVQESDESHEVQWSQLYNRKQSQYDEDDYNFDNIHCKTMNLQDHLRWQLDLTPMTDIDRAIATALIDATDDDGFLSLSLPELYASLNSEEYPLELAEIEAVQHRIQRFDPVGCASSNLAETLLVQLSQIPIDGSTRQLTQNILSNDLSLLGQHNYRQLMKNHHINEAKVEEILSLIQSLNPRPGSLIHQHTPEYITPDLCVKKINHQWTVQLNQSVLPELSINNHYAQLLSQANTSEDHQFLKHNLQEARWFLKSIQSRQETLLKVGTSIMAYQQGFLEFGEEAMKPLVLSDIAKALDLHESTVSRVTTQKFIHTPRGVFELKYFFSSHVNTDTGGECSSTAIRAVIKKLISSENRKKPLSDSKIANLISEQGIHVARRTVAKYREAMGISPSNERKLIHI